MKTVSREIRFVSRPNGVATHSNFEIAEVELPPLGSGEVRVRNTWMSIDPYMRGRMRDYLGERTGNLDNAFDREAVRGDQAIEWLPLDQFHGEKVDAVAFFHGVHRHDVGMIESGYGASLAMEPNEAFRILRHLSGQNFDCHVAPQPGISGAVHLSHTTGADGCLNFVDAEVSAGSQGHKASNDSSLSTERRTLRRIILSGSDGDACATPFKVDQVSDRA